MPNNKIQRRTLSKVEQQLLKERDEETRRIKEQKKNAWIKKQNCQKSILEPDFSYGC